MTMKHRGWIILAAAVSVVLLLSVGVVAVWADGVDGYDGGDRILVSSESVRILSDETEGDLLAAALELRVTGDVGGSIRACGGTLLLDSAVGRNVTVAGMFVSCAEDFQAGEVYIAGSQTEFYGECETLYIVGSKAIIGGTVHGEVICEADEVYFMEDASFEKATVTGSTRPVVVKRNGGAAEYTELDQSALADRVAFRKTESALVSGLKDLLYSLMAALVTALVLTFLFGKAANRMSLRLNARPVSFCLKGFGLMVGIPVICLFLLMLIVTLPISGALLLLYFAMLIVAQALTALVLGRLWFAKWSPYLSSCVLVVAITVLSAIPLIGGLCSFACVLVAFGCLASAIFDRKSSDPLMDEPLNPNGGMDFQV